MTKGQSGCIENRLRVETQAHEGNDEPENPDRKNALGNFRGHENPDRENALGN